MPHISIAFERFTDLTLGRLTEEPNVFTIWHGEASPRPALIGSGDVIGALATLTDAYHRLPAPWNGYLAVLDGLDDPAAAAATAVVPALLHDVAVGIGRPASQAPARAATARLRALCDSEPLRVSVRGCDPLRSPWVDGPPPTEQWIEVRADSTGYSLRHSWM